MESPTGYRKQDHAATVKHIPASKSWRAICPTCGPVGQWQAYPGDAEAIAERHREQNGFERQYT